MNVQREIDEANRRIRAQIDASARAALIRIGVDPDEVARAEAEAERQASLAPFEAWGTSWRQLADHFAAIAAAFRRGFENGGLS